MGVAAAARKYSKPQTRIIKLMPEAAEVQTAGWDLDVDLGDCRAMADHAIHVPVPNLQQQVIINLSAMMAYLRLYQHPEEDTLQDSATSTLLARDNALCCVCCGASASVDAVGFCLACAEAAEPA